MTMLLRNRFLTNKHKSGTDRMEEKSVFNQFDQI